MSTAGAEQSRAERERARAHKQQQLFSLSVTRRRQITKRQASARRSSSSLLPFPSSFPLSPSLAHGTTTASHDATTDVTIPADAIPAAA